MKNHLRIFSLLLACCALLLSSCETEDTEIENPPVEDSIVAESELANLIQRAAIEDRSFDDFIDLADCFSINLPFTVVINDVSLTINDENDYAAVIALIAKFNNKFDVELIYPIVITLNDFTQVVINAEEELIPFVAACLEMDQDIPCIEFVYPLSFSIFNIEFELIDTITIESNEALYLFIENLQAGVLVSLNFPVQMELQNGEIIELNSNAEIQAAIEAAELECNMMNQTEFGCYEFIIVDQGCDDDGNGEATFVLNIINAPENQQECAGLLPFSLTMHLTLEDAINGIIAPGILFNESVELASQTLYARFERIATGDFEIQPLELVVEACEGDADFSCFEDNLSDTLFRCVNSFNETAFFTLDFAVTFCEDETEFNVTYHTTEANAIVNQLAISNTESFSIESPFSDNIIYVRVTVTDNPDEFMIYPITLVVSNCNDDLCTEAELIGYLNQCVWNVEGPSEPYILQFEGGNVIAYLGNDSQARPLTTGTNIIESSGEEFPFFILDSFTDDFAPLNNVYEVGQCSEEQISVHTIDPGNIELVFTEMFRDCDTNCDNPGFLTDDLVIYMPFANEMVDLISDFEVNNPPAFFIEDRDGNPNCAAFFDGDSAAIPISDINNIVNGDAFAVSLWFQMANVNAGDLEKFIQKGSTDSEGFSIRVFDLNTPLCFSDNPPFNLWDDDWNNEVDVVWTNTDWHHLVITRSTDGNVQLWRDGVLRNSGTGMQVGNELDGFYYLGENFLGAMDDLRVYTRALNGNEIIQLYNLEADCFTCL